MNDEIRDDDVAAGTPRRPGLWLAAAGAALVLLAIGAAAGVLWTERRGGGAGQPIEAAGPAPRPLAAGGHGSHGGGGGSPAGGAPAGALEALEVSISPEAMQRAGIRLTAVRRDTVKPSTTVPASVTSNAYRDTKVNALAGGIVRDVSVELGVPVTRGQTLAVVFSQDLAEAQMRYLSLRAMLRADDQKLDRTHRLTEIGAASRQELEEVTAAQAARATEVAAARQRLQLLGLTREQVDSLGNAAQIVSDLAIVSPADGAVIARGINPGQVIVAGQDLFTVTDLSSVWVIGDLYEKDFAAVRVGTPAVVRAVSAPTRPQRGRVTYLDPRVDPATRTAKVRVEVPNRDGDLRLGMFVELTFDAVGREARLVVPRGAVQAIGQRNVVYVATEEEGRFQERTVRLGGVAGDAVEVLDGLELGERVVDEGSFFLRAEAGRARNAG